MKSTLMLEFDVMMCKFSHNAFENLSQNVNFTDGAIMGFDEHA